MSIPSSRGGKSEPHSPGSCLHSDSTASWSGWWLLSVSTFGPRLLVSPQSHCPSTPSRTNMCTQTRYGYKVGCFFEDCKKIFFFKRHLGRPNFPAGPQHGRLLLIYIGGKNLHKLMKHIWCASCKRTASRHDAWSYAMGSLSPCEQSGGRHVHLGL